MWRMPRSKDMKTRYYSEDSRLNYLLTAEELGQRLRVQPSTIKRWSQEGMIPALRLTGKVIRFDFAEVVQALRSDFMSRHK